MGVGDAKQRGHVQMRDQYRARAQFRSPAAFQEALCTTHCKRPPTSGGVVGNSRAGVERYTTTKATLDLLIASGPLSAHSEVRAPAENDCGKDVHI